MIAFLAGVMEANLTAHLMEQHWQNTESDFACGGDRELCTDVLRFLYRNNFYVGRDKDLSDARWYQVCMLYAMPIVLRKGKGRGVPYPLGFYVCAYHVTPG